MRSQQPSPSRIADALFGKARQRVLALLFGAPDRRLFLREIARIAGTGLGSVQRELARLTAAGLLVREREGRQTYYRANPDSPVANELRDLMRKTAGRHFASSLKTTHKVFAIGDEEEMDVLSRTHPAGQLDALRAKRGAIIAAAADHGARNVRVFGSVARDETDAGSDVDFLVDLEPGRSLLDLGGLVSDLEELLGRQVDVVTPRGLGPRLRQTVLNEALAL